MTGVAPRTGAPLGSPGMLYSAFHGEPDDDTAEAARLDTLDIAVPS